MTLWRELAPRLAGGDRLSYEESRQVMAEIMAGELGEIGLASYLSMVALRGVGVAELRGLADEMRSVAKPIDLPEQVVDIVGTGGDKANTVNISTMAALVIAAAGYPVVKHGNRASTSACGSADLLEELGVDLEMRSSEIIASFGAADIAFLFANKFHPSMRHAARVRRDLGFPTAFNILGPLTNPVRPVASAVGVARRDAAPLVAGVFRERGSSAFVFRGLEVGLDELSPVESAQVWVVSGGEISELEIDPASILGIPRCTVDDLRGGAAAHNAKVAREVFAGAEGPVRNSVAMNAAIGMMAGHAAGLPGPLAEVGLEGDWFEADGFAVALRAAYEVAEVTLASGATEETLRNWVEVSRTV